MLEIDARYQWSADKEFSAHYQVSIPTGLTILLGASGAGKSTLLQLLGGFLDGSGYIKLLGKNLMELAPYERPVTTLFQSDNLFPQLDVWHNVAIGLSPSLKLHKNEKELVAWSLAVTKVDSYRHKKPEMLSGGQLQRVALARAVARAAMTQEGKAKPILLLDEPFSALDPFLRMEMLQLVSDVTKKLGLTTLLVSHLPDEIKRVKAGLVLVDNGKVVLQNSTDILYQELLPTELMTYLTK